MTNQDGGEGDGVGPSSGRAVDDGSAEDAVGLSEGAGAHASSNHVEASQSHPQPQQHAAMGRHAEFGAAEEEVMRVLRVQMNFYAVLKVTITDSKAEIRSNYQHLYSLLDPSSCSHPNAQDSLAIVNRAYGTLVNPIKKKHYNKYLDEVHMSLSNGQSYVEWEAQQVENPPDVPAWAQKILKIRGGGVVMLCICFPITLVCLVLLALILLVTLPFRWCYQCCGEPSEAGPSPEQEASSDTENLTQQPPQDAGSSQYGNTPALRIDSLPGDSSHHALRV